MEVAGAPGSGSSAVQLNFAQRYVAALKPPYKGVVATIGGMTWARAFIFYGSYRGKVSAPLQLLFNPECQSRSEHAAQFSMLAT